MTAAAAPPPRPERPRRRRRRWLWWSTVPVVAYGVLVLAGMPASVPFDVVYTSWPVAVPAELAAPADGRRRLVVLQHGLWRSPWALWRIERALRAAGYEVLNPGYASTSDTGSIEAFADELAAAIEAAWGDGVDELSFVAHSMGGLVVLEYLRRPDARTPAATVFVAAPYRGAVLSDLRKHWWLFRLVMGTGAALQLSPGDHLHRRPLVLPGAVGAIVGDLGAGNPSIPGDDDGTVGVGEATVEGAADVVVVPYGHTRIAVADRVIRHVLEFLRRRRFAP